MKLFKKAINILEEAIWSAFLLDKYRRKTSKPGEVIQNLSSEKREVLSQLKSDEVEKIIVGEPAYYCGEFYTQRDENEKRSKIKMDFDKKLKK